MIRILACAVFNGAPNKCDVSTQQMKAVNKNCEIPGKGVGTCVDHAVT